MTLRLNGSSSGYIEIDAPAAAGSNSITLPTSNGSAEQFLKNSGTAGELEFSSMIEDSSGDVQARRARSNTAGDVALSIQPSDSTIHYGLRVDAANNSLNLDRASGTAFNILTVNSSGKLGLGTTTPGDLDNDANNLVIGDGSGNRGITIHSGTSSTGNIYFADGTSGGAQYAGGMNYNHTTNFLQFFTTDGTTRMRVTNHGRLDVFASSSTDSHFISSGASAGTSIELLRGMHSASSIAAGTTSIRIYTNGNIQNTNNSYGSISDVKLKENIADASSQWDDIKAIQIRNYNFKEDTGHPTHTQIGVVAQEVETVSPGLVYETPDTDNDGNALETVTKNVNYSVLYMKAVKALQEAQTRIETLETKVAALEAAE
jgi:hypothetical protein